MFYSDLIMIYTLMLECSYEAYICFIQHMKRIRHSAVASYRQSALDSTVVVRDLRKDMYYAMRAAKYIYLSLLTYYRGRIEVSAFQRINISISSNLLILFVFGLELCYRN